MISRRNWLAGLGGGSAMLLLGRVPAVQQRRDTSNLFTMDQAAARTVRLAPKPGASPSMTDDARDALEHRIRCQCGCTLDVYTCRTTDFSCQVSPAMHRDIIALVAGGYSAEEITTAFVSVYGDLARMAPPKEGFNILGYVLPGISIGVGAVVLLIVIRGLTRPSQAATGAAGGFDATPEELARIQAAVRDDE